MSARDVIRQIEALPLNEQREVIAYLERVRSTKREESNPEPMGVDDAIEHVFKNYDGLLEKLAQ
jgi:hypothetical protein